jgi:hypothetical protein
MGIKNFNLQYLKSMHRNSFKFCTKFTNYTVTIPTILSGKIFFLMKCYAWGYGKFPLLISQKLSIRIQ